MDSTNTETADGVVSNVVVLRIDSLERRVKSLEDGHTGHGYVCEVCKVRRPKNWFVYEIERDGFWLRPCCAMCARENKSRGPFPQNNPVSQCAESAEARKPSRT